jgi:hypothetical protein
MDHPCHKCGHSIEDGKPFCAQCGAPQIRVALPEAPVEASAINVDSAAVTEPAHGAAPEFPAVAISPLASSWPNALRPCALAAAVGALLTFLGLNPFVGALAAGFLAANFSQRRNPGVADRPAAGAKLGAFGGLLLFGLSTILETLAVVVLHKGAEIRTQLMDKIQQAAERYPGPQVEPFLQFVKTPGGFAFMMAASVIFGLIAFCVLGAVGGAISGAFSGRRGSR